MCVSEPFSSQDEAQKVVVNWLIDQAKTAGISDVRLATSALETIYAKPTEMGFMEAQPGCPWLSCEM